MSCMKTRVAHSLSLATKFGPLYTLLKSSLPRPLVPVYEKVLTATIPKGHMENSIKQASILFTWSIGCR